MSAFDYYKQGEDAIGVLLRQIEQLSHYEWQVMTGDTTGVIKGEENFVLLYPESFSDTVVESQQAEVDWGTELRMYVKFGELQPSWNALRALRSEIFYKVLQYPSLGGVAGVTSVRIGAPAGPTYIVDDPDVAEPTPLFISQNLIVTWHQILPINGGEYA